MNPFGVFTRDGKLLALGGEPGVVRLVVTDTGVEIARLTASTQVRLKPRCCTADGQKLVATGHDTNILYVFDLAAIRRGLAELDLDWNAPPVAPRKADATQFAPPLQVTVELGLSFSQEPPRQAIVKYSLALAVLPINSVAYLRRGHAYFRFGQWRLAADDLGLALALDPGNKDIQAWSELAAACRQSLRLKEAAAACTRLLQLGGEDATIYNQRGVAYHALGLYDKAIADLEKALKLHPDYPMVNNNLAWNLATCPVPKFRDPVRAAQLAKQAVDASPKDAIFLTTLGVAHYRAGDWTAACDALRKSRQVGKGTENSSGMDARCCSWP